MSPEYVRPYVKAQKNDDRDAEAIAEAASRPTMRFVELKSQDRLDLQSLHRVRSRLVNARKTLINQLRAILLERGHVIARGPQRLDRALDEILAREELDISGRMCTLVTEMRDEWRDLDRRIEALNAEFKEHVRAHEAARRLRDPAKATAVAGPINEKMIEGLNGWSRQVPDQFAIGMPSRCCPACHRQAYQQLRHGNEQLPVLEDFDHRLGNRHTLFGGGRFACSSSDQHAVVARSDGLKVQSGDDLPGMFAARFLALGIEPWLRRH